MGKVEKIVVLSVAFLIVVILAISTQGGGSDPVQAAAEEPAGGEDRPALQAPSDLVGETPEVVGPSGNAEPGQGNDAVDGVGSAVVNEGGRTPGDETSGDRLAPPPSDPARSPGQGLADGARATIDGSSRPSPEGSGVPVEPVYDVPTEIPADWDLVTLAGLADHLFDPTLKVYTAQRNDTFLKIARRYYGDDAFVAALERNNEGLEKLNPGHQLLLPVRAREILEEPADRYVVQDGESLWKIAKKVYGAGHRWGEIYEANRGVLSSPDAVTPGTTLRIP